MTTALDDACRELRALLKGKAVRAVLDVTKDGRVSIQVWDAKGQHLKSGVADLEFPGDPLPLPSELLRTLACRTQPPK
jgi:hypothetical protein